MKSRWPCGQGGVGEGGAVEQLASNVAKNDSAMLVQNGDTDVAAREGFFMAMDSITSHLVAGDIRELNISSNYRAAE